jgi:hypothetical protein
MQKLMKLTIAEALQGAEVDDSMPVAWLSTFVARVKNATDGMQPGEVVVRGAAGIWAEWKHTLTPQEEAQLRLDGYAAVIARAKMLLGEGDTLTSEQVKALRELLG